MREHLFKGKRIDNGEWVEGFYFYDIGDCIKERPSSVSTNTYLVDPETVCEYTGLRDKDGKLIFEGDIVRHGYESNLGCFYHKYEVAYSKNNACYDLICTTPYYSTKRLTKKNILSKKTESVGNIFDNPELLEGGEGNA